MTAKDDMIDLLRARFQGHEMPVAPGTWEAIAAGMAAGAPAADGLSKLLQERFAGHEAAVDPGVWEAINSQIGQGATSGAAAGSGWLSSTMAWVGAGIGAAALVAGGLFLSNPEPATPPQKQVAPVVSENDKPRPVPVEEMPAERSGATALVTAPETRNIERSVTHEPKALSDRAHSPDPSTITDPETMTPGDDADKGVRTDTPPADQQPQVPSEEGPEIVDRLVQEMTLPVVVTPQVIDTPDPVVPQASTAGPVPDPVPATASTPEEPSFRIYLPNVFTPNGDGINDTYVAQGTNIGRVMIRVYSVADNQLVFRSESLTPWDGHDLNGTPCPEGHYLYAIEVIGDDGKVHTRGQTVLLTR